MLRQINAAWKAALIIKGDVMYRNTASNTGRSMASPQQPGNAG
jgi:hypothetical protein